MTFRALAKVTNSFECARSGRGKVGWQQGRRRADSPLFALILYFIAQVEVDLPVLAGKSLICGFHYFVEERG
jgi:hypothetical protein